MRPRISPAALLVKVTARMPWGEARSAWITQAMRWVRTRVLPLPAPASTSTGPAAAVTAARCASFRGLRTGDRSIGGHFTGKAPTSGAVAGAVVQLDVAHQRHREAEHHGTDDEPEDAEGGRAADCADEDRERRDFRLARGEERAQHVLQHPHARGPKAEENPRPPVSGDQQVDDRGDEHDPRARGKKRGDRSDHPEYHRRGEPRDR